MEKIINKLINESTKGVDTYSHNGSTWLIFTETKQWVIELTESKTLWYNFNFFKNLFAYASLEVVQNQHLITKWVEDNVMNGSKYTASPSQTPSYNLTEVFENRIKETCWNPEDNTSWVKGVIKAGVKETRPEHNITEGEVDDIIQDGVKHTARNNACADWEIEDTIQNGVRSSIPRQYVINQIIDDTINYGVKNIMPGSPNHFGLEDTLDNGIKETHDDVYHHKGRIDGVIKNGVKETQPLPDQSGEIIGYGNYYDSKEDRTKAFIDYLEETIEKGVKIN